MTKLSDQTGIEVERMMATAGRLDGAYPLQAVRDTVTVLGIDAAVFEETLHAMLVRMGMDPADDSHVS